ncbi:MAG: hypothetical protein A4S14_09560 [Proteobacteria bacterium SG_bin9]|nr:MAG: hypothetical protein A4S14_09560 [Proteobacteria bacterium SG_bin9]
MGLMDILNGMQNGPRGETQPGKGGMSPMTMAILALLAYKALGHLRGGQPQTKPAGVPPQLPPGGTVTAGLPGGLPGGLGDILKGGGAGGGLSDLMKGGLGGLILGGAAGSILSGGLGDLMKQLQDKGHGDVADSWVGKGANKQIDPNDLANALGADQISTLLDQTGMSRNELLQGLSQYLPGVVDQLTPDGRLPTEGEASRWL